MLRSLFFTAVVACLSVSGLSGCASGSHAHPRDPLEPANRVVYQFNDKADQYVMKPVAEGYRAVTPWWLRARVNHFFSNLGDANSAFNYSLQAEPLAAYYSLARFILNSTAGVAGLFDVTGEEQRRYEQVGFGDTLARWGWKDSSYLVLPLIGPSTVRDTAGTVVNAVFTNDALYGSPHRDALVISASVGAVSVRERLLGVEDGISRAALDRYSYTRDVWLQMRARKTGDSSLQQDDFSIDDLME